MVQKTVFEAREGARIDPVRADDRFDHLAIRLRAGQIRAEVIAELTSRAAHALGRRLARLARHLRQNWRRRTTLAELAQLDDRILKDIGVSRDQLGVVAARAAANENRRRAPDAA